MVVDPIYSDKLVEITEESILFRNYYFPFGSRTVLFSDVSSVAAKEPTHEWWRVHGTVDFLT